MRISANEYGERRERVMDALPDDKLVVIINSEQLKRVEDSSHPFRVDNFFYYLTGSEQEGGALILDPRTGESTILAREYSTEERTWRKSQGLKTLDEIRLETGVYRVLSTSSFNEDGELETPNFLHDSEKLAAFFNDQFNVNLSTREAVHSLPNPVLQGNESPLPEHSYRVDDLARILVGMRKVKSQDEIAAIRESASVSVEAFRTALDFVQPGANEELIERALYNVYSRHGCDHTFLPIATQNGYDLHSENNTNVLEGGRMLVIDSGAEKDNYGSDFTITVPVNGVFTEKQRLIYNLVLDTRNTVTSQMGPGVNFQELHYKAERLLARGLQHEDIGIIRPESDLDEVINTEALQLFFYHGLGHHLGLGVHDAGDYGDLVAEYDEDHKRATTRGRNWLRFRGDLKEGHVITVEPGLYFNPEYLEDPEIISKYGHLIDFEVAQSYIKEVSGIRLEHDVAITNNGFEVIGKGIPQGVAEIEELMKRPRRADPFLPIS